MKVFRILAILFALAVLLCACNTEQPRQTISQPYTVTVVDETGVPIPGVMVQLCLDACYPGVTDANGQAEFSVSTADYKVSLLTLPAGYSYSSEAREFQFIQGSFALTITLNREKQAQ